MTYLQNEICGKMSPENLDILKNLGVDGRYQSGCYRPVSWSQLAFVCVGDKLFLVFCKR
jgi:hypothetical protein